MITQVFAVEITKITNEFLIEDGWKKGMLVRLHHNVYGGDTFEAVREVGDAAFFASQLVAESEIKKREDSFVDVEFGVVKFSR